MYSALPVESLSVCLHMLPWQGHRLTEGQRPSNPVQYETCGCTNLDGYDWPGRGGLGAAWQGCRGRMCLGLLLLLLLPVVVLPWGEQDADGVQHALQSVGTEALLNNGPRSTLTGSHAAHRGDDRTHPRDDPP
jgi:hypothetical protein